MRILNPDLKRRLSLLAIALVVIVGYHGCVRCQSSRSMKIEPIEGVEITNLNIEMRLQRNGEAIITETVELLNGGGEPLESYGKALPSHRLYDSGMSSGDNAEQIPKAVLEYQFTEDDPGYSPLLGNVSHGGLYVNYFGRPDTEENKLQIGSNVLNYQYAVKGNFVPSEDFDLFMWPLSGYMYLIPTDRVNAVIQVEQPFEAENLAVSAYSFETLPEAGVPWPSNIEDKNTDKARTSIVDDPNRDRQVWQIWTVDKLEPYEVLIVEIRIAQGFLTE